LPRRKGEQPETAAEIGPRREKRQPDLDSKTETRIAVSQEKEKAGGKTAVGGGVRGQASSRGGGSPQQGWKVPGGRTHGATKRKTRIGRGEERDEGGMSRGKRSSTCSAGVRSGGKGEANRGSHKRKVFLL